MTLRARLWCCAVVLPLAAWLGHAALGAPQQGFQIHRVTDHVSVISGRGGNVTVWEGDEAAVVIDAKGKQEGKDLIAAIHGITSKPLRFLIDTHHHRESCGGNAAFPSSTIIIAQEHALRRMDGTRRPDVTFDSTLTLHLDNETIACRHKGRGHTESDCFVYFERDKVLVLGDLVYAAIHPVVVPEDGASMRHWLAVLHEIRRDFKSVDSIHVVPGLGEPGSATLIDAQIGYLQDILDLMDDAHRHGLTLQEALQSAQPIREKYLSWSGDQLERNLRLAYEETAR